PGPKIPVKTVAEALDVEEGVPEAAPTRHHHTRDLTVKIAGFGGQGILLMGQLLAEMALRENMEVSWLPSYGPEMRSGSAHCHVTLSHDRLGTAKVANVVMLGALLEETECMPAESAISVLEATVKNPKLLELDKLAIAAGRGYIDTEVEVGAVCQPDGYSY